ncbi:MAG: hypothetical protein IH940_09740 [Acidobacteria bacterium]|nr:hypothetical protein [Acidobacteriota bacterium]
MSPGDATSTAPNTRPDTATVEGPVDVVDGKHFAQTRRAAADNGLPVWPDDAFTEIAPRWIRSFDARR